MITKGRCVKAGVHYHAGNCRRNRVKMFAGGTAPRFLNGTWPLMLYSSSGKGPPSDFIGSA